MKKVLHKIAVIAGQRRLLPSLLVLAFIGLLSYAVLPLHAAVEDLDASFGAGGKVTTDFFGLDDEARAIVIQPDGKIIAVGGAAVINTPNTISRFGLARYNSDGSLDPTFGVGGKVTTDFFGIAADAYAAAIQPDGKIVVAGVTTVNNSSDFALARYNADGSLDASFGSGGKVTTDFLGNFEQAYAVAVQPDGKIVAAGFSVIETGRNWDFALARYNANGSLDTSFGSGGKVTTNFISGINENSYDQAFGIALQANGKIVAAGRSSGGMGSSFALARYNSNGTLDTSFGSTGKVTTNLGGGAYAVAIQVDGKIVAAGVASDSDFALARYNTDGSLDASFGSGGKVTTDFFGGFDQAQAIAIQSDGKIIAAGVDVIGNSNDFALARYNSDGSLDSSFGNGGKMTTDFFGSNDAASGIALQPDGKIVVAGAAKSTVFHFALARYNGLPSTVADLALAKSHVGNFAVGANGLYTLTVANVAPVSSAGTITVIDSLPAGLNFISGTGTGWSCSALGSIVTCTNPNPLAPGASTSIALTVSVSSAAMPSVTNSASVANAIAENPLNDTATDFTLVAPACTYSIAPSNQTLMDAGGSGSITVTSPSGCPWTAVSSANWITITAGGSGNGNGTVSYSVTSNPDPRSRTSAITVAGQTFTITQAKPTASVSGASYFGNSGLAPESIVSAFGRTLATTTQVASSIPLPTSLAGTTVKVKDTVGTERLAPLFYASPTQINYLIPQGTATGAAMITITSGDGSISMGTAQIAAVAPGLFAANSAGQGVAAAVAFRVKGDGTQSYELVAQFDAMQNKVVSIPLDLGPPTDQVFLFLYGTGIRFRSSLLAVSAKIGGVPAQVLYAGAQPDFAGLDQMNVTVPRSLIGRGEVDIVLTVDGQTANIVKINIH